MSDSATEKTITRILSIGSAFITVFILSGSVTDPVNSTKFLILGMVGIGAIGLVAFFNLKETFRLNKVVLSVLTFFVLSAIISSLLSASPLSQNLFGSYGRNSGLYTYVFLAFVLIATLTIKNISNLEKMIYGLGIAGLINVAYCLWVILFGDFVGWENPYGNILGTLGNPNFIGAFLGMFFSILIAYFFKPGLNLKWRLSIAGVAALTFLEIYKSHAIQGRVVAGIGLAIVGFLVIRSRFNLVITALYSLFVTTISLFSILGALQIGPLTKYIYKYSVSLRGQYWLAGWNTGQEHPIHGVGMDAFGDWYRRMRDIHALTVPGVNTIVNAAHNVFMDMFAFGGWPLFISYVVVVLLGGLALIKVVLRTKSYDPIFASMSTAWIGYQAQSIISINQIGLAIWGWLLTGALLAYERNTRSQNLEVVSQKTAVGKKSSSRKTSGSSVISPGLVAGLGIVVGAILASPPIAADMKWRSATLARTTQALEGALTPSFMNPQNTTKYLTSIQAFESSNLTDLAHKYATEAVKFNPESFELWKVFYLIQASTPEEKAIALENMKRLDPLNPDVTAR